MKNFLIIAIFIFLSFLRSFGQNANTDSIHRLIQKRSVLKNGVSDTTKICIGCRPGIGAPLFLVNDTIIVYNLIGFIINVESISKIDVLHEVEAMKRFGDKAKFGAVLIWLDHNITPINLKSLLLAFDIDKNLWSLPVCINDYFYPNPDTIVADISAIKSIEISNGQYALNASELSTLQKYINIQTKRKD